MFDEKEEKILKELIKNPRVSDNQIAKNTKIPVMTVNRKRKKLEDDGKVFYFTYVNESNFEYNASQLYIIKFKSGITREMYLNKIKTDPKFKEDYSKYVYDTYLGEKDGHLALVMTLEASNESELVEIFNGLIIRSMKFNFGDDAILEIITARISLPVRVHHNYLPFINMSNGIMKKGWSDDYIYVNKKENRSNSQKYLFNFE